LLHVAHIEERLENDLKVLPFQLFIH